MLVEKRSGIDLSLCSPEAGSSSSKTKTEDLIANNLNVSNRHWEVTYSYHIEQSVFYSCSSFSGSFTYSQHRANVENEAWNEVDLKYKAYGEKLQASLQERKDALYKPDQFIHRETRLADEIETELDKRLGSALEFKIDQIFSFINAARATTYIAEKALNERFDIIASNLKSRLNLHHPHPHPPPSASTADLTQMPGPSTYITNPRSAAIPDRPNPLDLMRALTRIDVARRAAREVQRVGESAIERGS